MQFKKVKKVLRLTEMDLPECPCCTCQGLGPVMGRWPWYQCHTGFIEQQQVLSAVSEMPQKRSERCISVSTIGTDIRTKSVSNGTYAIIMACIRSNGET